MPFIARMLMCSTIILLIRVLLICGTAAEPVQQKRIVYLAHDLSDEQLIVLGATLAAWRPDNVLLLDSVKASPYLKAFLTTYKPDQIVLLGGDPDSLVELSRRLDIKASALLGWRRGQPWALWRSLFQRAEDVVVCPLRPRGALLQAACLAAVLHAPLYVLHGHDSEVARLVH